MSQSCRLIAGILSVILVLAYCMPISAKEAQWETHLNAGTKATMGGDYDEAQTELLEALRLTAKFQSNDPRLSQTYYQVGQLRLKQQDWSDAKQYFERALKIQEKLGDPESVDIGNTLSGLATAHEQLSDHEMAVLLLKRVRAIWTKHYGARDSRLTTVLPAMATYAMLDSDYATAQECYQRLVDIEEQAGGENRAHLGSALNSLASCLAYIGKFSEAEPIAQRALTVLTAAGDTPTSIDSASANLRYIEQRLGKDYPPAVAQSAPSAPSQVSNAYPSAVTQSAPNAPSHVSVDVQGKLLGSNTGANQQITTKQVMRAPSYSTPTTSNEFKPWELNTGYKESPAGKQPQSNENSGKIQYLAGGRLISPDQYRAMTLANSAYELIREEKYTMAIEILKNALAIYPDLASAHSNLGLAFSQLGQNGDAVAHLRQAIAIDAARPAAWLNLASTFQMGGQLKEAVATYGEFIQRFPSQPLLTTAQEVRSQLTRELKDQSEVEQALDAQGASANDYFTYASHGGKLRWTADKSTIKVYISSGIDTPGFKAEYAGFLADSFKQWEAACRQKVQFQLVKTPDGSDIECAWTDNAAKIGSPLEGGETSIVHGAGSISHATITILTKGPTADSPLSPNQLRAVCLHEIGHALGLVGHSPKPQDVMYCSVPPASVKVPISERDAATIQKLYANGQMVSWVSW